MVNKLQHTIKCDLCHGEFRLNKDSVKEEQVTLLKEGSEPHPVVLTYLNCPLCGKRYPVIMDDAKTLPILAKMRRVVAKQVKLAKAGKPASPELAKKRSSWALWAVLLPSCFCLLLLPGSSM